MKYIFYIFLFFYINVSATNYYVKTGGNDNDNGLSDATAWGTIAKVNSFQGSLNPGDYVFFKRGDTFRGGITLSKSGVSGSRIVYGAYGSGEKPIITGFETLNSWTNEGGGIYSKTVACQSSPNHITINNQWYAMGRYPNNSYLIYESFVTNNSITDNQLTAVPSWTGADVVLKKNDFRLDRGTITLHSGSTLTYTGTSSTGGTANYGYFIQNDLKTLDVFGEWYYTGSKIYVYFGAENPENYTLSVPTINNLIYGYRQSYITLENIQFIGSGRETIYMESFADYFIVQDCYFDFAGESTLKFISGVRYATINNNTIEHSVRTGIYVDGSINPTITNNRIINSGMLLGASSGATQNDGIYLNYCDDALIQYNVIDSSAYNGMYITGNRVKVKNNFITNSVILLNDGGGIYSSSMTFTGREISGNIILKTFGNTAGSNKTSRWARGIYLDVSGSDFVVENNTAAWNGDYGIFNGGGSGNTFINNTTYDNAMGGMFFQDYFSYNGGIHMSNNTLTDNKFVAKTNSEYPLRFAASDLYIPSSFAFADNNIYARPIDNNLVIRKGAEPYYITLDNWKALSGQDTNSKGSPITITDTSKFRFYFNPTNVDVVIEPDTNMIDMNGIKIADHVTVPAWRSLVLLVDPEGVGTRTLKSDRKLFVYPNPAMSQLWIKVPDMNKEWYNFSLMDIQGKEIVKGQIGSLSNGIYPIDIRNVSSGIYLIRVEGIDGIGYNERVIIRR